VPSDRDPGHLVRADGRRTLPKPVSPWGLPRFQSTAKLVPQPQADLAFGLRTAKWLPISSSV
jgi:hypothetical protein